jgi:Major intrinsic protein
VLTALVGTLGHVTGAHLDGAATIGLAVTGKFSWSYLPAYLVLQALGATAGAGASHRTDDGARRPDAGPRVGDLSPAAAHDTEG